MDYNQSISIGGVPFDRTTALNETADGFAFGAGGEFAISDLVSIGVEYLHANLENKGAGLQGIVPAALIGVSAGSSTAERNIDVDTVSARLNFKMSE